MQVMQSNFGFPSISINITRLGMQSVDGGGKKAGRDDGLGWDGMQGSVVGCDICR